jgi:5'-3' exonuclease
MQFEFELGTPFKPFEQLMGVLPFASREHIPLAYQVSFFIQKIEHIVLMVVVRI